MIGGAWGNFARRKIPTRAVSEEIMYSAISLADNRGVMRWLVGKTAMDEILVSVKITPWRSLCIGNLALETLAAEGLEHLGSDGFFLFEVDETPGKSKLQVLAKVPSLEAGFRLADLWSERIDGSANIRNIATA